MSDIVRHPWPWPPMTDRPGPGEAVCRATAEAWTCTRPAGHSFDHEAGGAGGEKYASWPAEGTAEEQRCQNCAPGYDCESGIYTRPEVAG